MIHHFHYIYTIELCDIYFELNIEAKCAYKNLNLCYYDCFITGCKIMHFLCLKCQLQRYNNL